MKTLEVTEKENKRLNNYLSRYISFVSKRMKRMSPIMAKPMSGSQEARKGVNVSPSFPKADIHAPLPWYSTIKMKVKMTLHDLLLILKVSDKGTPRKATMIGPRAFANRV